MNFRSFLPLVLLGAATVLPLTSSADLLKHRGRIAERHFKHLSDRHRNHREHDRDDRHRHDYRHHHHHYRGHYGYGYGSAYRYGYGHGYGYRPYYYGGPSIGFSYHSRPSYYSSTVYRGVPASNASDELAVDVQRELQRRGYYRGAIDGDIGPGSRSAIRAYQADRGLAATGRIDSRLLRSLGIG
jgi:hypothetical protein